MKLGEHSNSFNKAFDELKKERIIERIWEKDYTVWNNEPTEITNRLGWLFSPETSLKALQEIEDFVKGVKDDGFNKILLMGMGGSSLAPEVFSLTFGSKEGYPELHVLDSTDPDAVSEFDKILSNEKTLFIISTKSGGTVETFSFMKYFYNQTLNKHGKEETGKRFVAITDPGSGLEKAAKELNFRKIFLNDPDIGGRYSALSFFGIVPAALIGIDVAKLLKRADDSSKNSKVSDSLSGQLGTAIGELAKQGKDKLTFIISPQISFFGAWVEQLIAESTGKNGKGILPVDGESLEAPEYYSYNRLFLYIHLKDEHKEREAVKKLSNAGHPVIEIILDDLYDLGEQYFIWEMATAVAGWRLGIQPFDQPDVESAKVLARNMVKEYQEKGKLPEQTAILNKDKITLYGDIKVNSVSEAIKKFLDDSLTMGSYVTLQAYIKPGKDSSDILQKFRTKIQKRYKTAVTIGYGPRFLHSTGQLHKGDAGNGLFIQFTSSPENDLSIPDNPGEEKSSITFGILKSAQALGDRQALLDKGRKVLRFDLGTDVISGLRKINDTL
ncbi:MAG: glucose-6-phosphate isomerase [Ignavibacteria bacterium]|nr:glucose-6-phosphate isomerase [Ignavibacteria bacterium]